jgi:hypothetical protein
VLGSSHPLLEGHVRAQLMTLLKIGFRRLRWAGIHSLYGAKTLSDSSSSCYLDKIAF